MAGDIGYWLAAIPVRIVLGVVLGVIILVVIIVVAIILECASNFRAWWRSPRMRVLRLGGVTTLRRSLSYPCTMCHDSMEAGEMVRTLSCDHVFHCGGSDKCEYGIDAWLLERDGTCPNCRQVPHPVLPWRRPPPSSPAPSSPQTSGSGSGSGLEEELLFPSHWFDETSDSGSGSGSGSEEELLFPSHWFDETLPV